MASKKDKHLESAQRFLLKGQLDKAIKDYQQVVALEPTEIRYRQKLAELLVRDSRKEEAIAQYEGIAKDYANNSHYLKAIAVYKQIQRLVPGNAEITLQLASLNHKQGLIGNAFAEYGQVVAQYEKEGAPKDALKVLEQMLVIDGEHAATRLKYAELLFSTGSKDASYDALSSLHASLKKKGDAPAAQQVAQRMRQLFPDRQPDEIEALSRSISAGQHDAALDNLREKVKRDPMNLQAWKLLCEAERAAGNSGALKIALGQMMNLFPDDLGVLESGIRFPLDGGDFRGALALLELHLPRFLDGQAAATAEALFLAIPADVALEPRVSDGLRRLYQATGDNAKLQNLQPGGQPRPEQAPLGYGELPSAFGEEPPATPSAFAADPAGFSSAAPTAPVAHGSGWEEEIELDLDDDTTVTGPVASEVELPLDFSQSLELEELPSEEPSFAEAGGAGEAVADDHASPFGEWESPFGELPASFAEEPPAAEADPPSPFASSPFDEAPSAFGEEAPSAFGQPVSAFGEDAPAGSLAPSLEEEPSPFGAGSLPSGEAFGEAAAAGAGALPEMGEIASGHFGSDEEVVEGDQLALVLPDDAEFPDIEWAEDVDDGASAAPPEPQEELPQALEPAHGLEEELAPLEEVEEIEDLEEVGHEDHAVHEPVEAPFAQEGRPLHDWREIFPEAAAAEPADQEELESHYDLGVGYKEMGMYGQAIKEFSMAAANPKRRLDCLTLQAACYRDKGEPEKAQDLLERGRELDVLSDGERAAVSYELAYLLEGTGAVEQAVELYREVLRHDRSFHDVAQRLSALTGEEPLDVIDLDLEEG